MSSRARESSYPPRLRLLIACVLTLAVPVVAGAVVRVAADRPSPSRALAVLVFLALAFLADLMPVPLDESGDRSVSLAFVFVLSSQILFGWEYAVLTGAVSVLLPQAIERRPPVRSLYNTGVYALAAFASAFPWLLVSRPTGLNAATVTLLCFAGGAAFVGLNVLLVCLAVSLFQERPLRPLLLDNLKHGGPAFLTMAFLAALAVVLWRTDHVSLALLAGPLVALTLYQRSLLASRIATHHAHTDSLTGLGNHRAYELELSAALERAKADRTQLSLCVLDVDDFKQINDSHGHHNGDAALRELAPLFAMSDDARIFRLGGDEFAILFDGDGEHAARHVARMLDRLGETTFPHGDSVTLSVGIGVFPTHADDGERLERVVDSALYWAKHHGKNRVCLFDPSVVRPLSSGELTRLAAREARLKAAEQLIRAVDVKDTYTGEHSQSVARLVKGIAEELGLGQALVEQVRLAGLLHDLGKLGIPDQILKKPGRLTPHEQSIVRTHPALGHSLLDGLELEPIDAWILHHHEHWDGSGYPQGLAGEEIPLGSRIILVADAYDAMLSERSYRGATSAQDAVRELQRMAGEQFDPKVVRALESHLGVEPVGRNRPGLGRSARRADRARRVGQMVLAIPIVVAVALGLLCGGSLRQLSNLTLRRVELFYLAVAVQLVAFPFAFLPWATGDQLGRALWLGSYALLCCGALVNVRITGVPIVAAGMVSNIAAVVVNGGHMPVLPQALRDAGKSYLVHFNSAADSAPGLPWLVDRWAVPQWLHVGNVFSVGDVVIAIGVLVLVFAAMGARHPLVASRRPAPSRS